MATEISWRVIAYLNNRKNPPIKEDFLDSIEADRKYVSLRDQLTNIGDKVTLYRIKRVTVPDDLLCTLTAQARTRLAKKRNIISSYQDAYKTDIVGRDGKLIHVRGTSPANVSIAEQQREKARESRRRSYARHKDLRHLLKSVYR